MKKILWITDGAAWNWDTRSLALSSALPEFTHIFAVFANASDGAQVNEYIKHEKPDVLMCFSLNLLPRITYKGIIITSLAGERLIESQGTRLIKKKKILWIGDGWGWGWDILIEAMRIRMPEFEHISIGTNLSRARARLNIRQLQVDLIMCLPPQMAKELNNITPVITTLSGERECADAYS